jgi:hypothetical protein
VSEPSRTELSNDPADYITGPVLGESARTEGGTTKDGAVATFGSSRTGEGAPTGAPSPTGEGNPTGEVTA